MKKAALSLLMAGLLIPWVIVVWIFIGHPRIKSVPARPVANDATPGTLVQCQPGPWGDLEYYRILIEPPEDQIYANFPKVDTITWHFPGYTRAALDELWQQAGLNSATQTLVTQAVRATTDGQKLEVSVPASLVLGLDQEARGVIYGALSVFAENAAQREPFRFNQSRAKEWFAGSGLQPETIEKVSALLYQQGNSLLFSDQQALMPTIPSMQERTRLLKTLARKSTMVVSLRLHENTDIAALDSYWGRGSRAKDIKPLLESIPRTGRAISIDITHLLPRFARSLLYTYPAVDDPGSSSFIDCHWTVLNFFNTEPDPRFAEIEAVSTAFQQDYHPITGPPRFGDIYMFVTEDGDVLHSCVHIADDIVFTKNGASANSPWIFMTLADAVAFYPSRTPLDVQLYRKKDL